MNNLDKPWEEWFLIAINKESFIEVNILNNEVTFENKKNWTIHLCQYNEGKLVRSSFIINYFDKKSKVETKNKSIYELGKPYNKNQLKMLNYFFMEA
tara:strand:+ start:11103 stop:11393 length:291 start_codon:yes stop_codon:yes gene_type:complete